MKRVFRGAVAAVLLLTFQISASAAKMLIPVGEVVGLSVHEGTVKVVAFDENLGFAAREAGIKIGDEIRQVDGEEINSATDLQQALLRSDGELELTLLREGKTHSIEMQPQITDQGPKLGVYIREGVTGIGTVTYYDPESGGFGALGHGVSDSHGQLAGMVSGKIYEATVASVKHGQPGLPGQLKGSVCGAEAIGTIQVNSAKGIFGQGCRWRGEALPAATAAEAHIGPATILANVSGDKVEEFSVEIQKVCPPENDNGRDLLLQVTDEALLSATGGIVAGMSGSPIIQDGKLVGAVTHVLVNDPTTGYGIFIENMLDAAE